MYIYIFIFTQKQYNFSPVRIIADPSCFHIIHKFENGDFILCAIACQLSGRPEPAVWGCRLSGQPPSPAQPSPAQPAAQPSPVQPNQPAQPSQRSPAMPASPTPTQPCQPASPDWKPFRTTPSSHLGRNPAEIRQKSGTNPAQIRHKSGTTRRIVAIFFCKIMCQKHGVFVSFF